MLWLHIATPESGVKYSQWENCKGNHLLISWHQENSSLLLGKVWYTFHLLKVSFSQLQQRRLETKHWVNIAEWTNLKCDYWTSIRQHLLHSVQHKWVSEWRERKSDPEKMFFLTLKTFSATISRVCFSYSFAKLCSWAASKTQGWISIWHKLSPAQWSYNNGANLIQKKQTPPGKAE